MKSLRYFPGKSYFHGVAIINPMLRFLCILFFVFFSSQVSRAQNSRLVFDSGKLTIGKFEFNYLELSPGSGNLEVFELYAGKRKLLSHTIGDFDNQHDPIKMEIGDFSVINSSIILYSYWEWDDTYSNVFFGGRRQIYTTDSCGELRLTASSVYLELYKERLAKMAPEEAAKLIAALEKEYNAKYVTGFQAEDLIRDAKREIEKETLWK